MLGVATSQCCFSGEQVDVHDILLEPVHQVPSGLMPGNFDAARALFCAALNCVSFEVF